MSLFEPFYDPENSTICVDADATVKQINTGTGPDGLYFPLWIEEDRSLADHIYSQPFASRSFRYGTFGDNVLGMNFKAGGTTVKIGGRTIKNVVGFDFIRFLCGSGKRFGDIEQLVVRLRPLAECSGAWVVKGDYPSLDGLRKTYLKSPWSHSADAFDFDVDEKGLRLFLLFPFSRGQEGVLQEYLDELGGKFGVEISPVDGLPVCESAPLARIKTTLSRTLPEASDLVRRFGGRSRGYLGNGFFMYQTDAARSPGDELTSYLQDLHKRVSSQGGHVDSPGLKYKPSEEEERWEEVLTEEWSKLGEMD
ncbi:FAD-binding oxidoreductase [Fibrobacterota bacterium]